MKEWLFKTLRALIALTIAIAIWLPSLNLIYKRPAANFASDQELSPQARKLAARHLELWTDPELRTREMQRMRASNAEWDFMGRSFLVWSLANMGLREPASKQIYLNTIDRIIEETLRLEAEKGMTFFLMRYAKARPYVIQPARSLFLDGEIALMLASRRMLEEKESYKPLLTERVNLIATGLQQSPHFVLESYPDECWMFDHCVALAAIRLANFLDGSDHSKLTQEWLVVAKKKLVHPESGLLVSSFTTDGKVLDGPEGSSIWMVAHCLQLIDEDFARDQYERAHKQLGETVLGFGYAREWPASWDGPADVDSGPIIPVLEISAGSSGMAFIGATAFADQRYLVSLASTLEFAAFPELKRGRLKYCASNQVGDAVLLYAATLGPIWQKVKAGGKS